MNNYSDWHACGRQPANEDTRLRLVGTTAFELLVAFCAAAAEQPPNAAFVGYIAGLATIGRENTVSSDEASASKAYSAFDSILSEARKFFDNPRLV